jgi:hypothetical protein
MPTPSNPEFESTVNRTGPGTFGVILKSDPEIALVAEPTAAERIAATLQAAADESRRIAAAAKHAHGKAAVDLVHHTLRTAFPTATRAEYFRSWDNDSENLMLRNIYNGDDIIFSAASREFLSHEGFYTAFRQGELVEDIAEYLGYVDNDALEEEGTIASLDLVADRDPYYSYNPSAALDLPNMSWQNAGAVFRDAGNEIGAIMISADKTEIAYRIEEEPELHGYDEDTWERLETKFGSRKAALNAIADTQAWNSLEETANNFLYERSGNQAITVIDNAIMAAIDELDV